MEYIYKYVSETIGSVVYVGIASDLDRRVLEHSKEPKFKDDDYKIYFAEFQSRTDVEALEGHFISLYKTYEGKGMNKRKCRWGLCSFAPEVNWKEYFPTTLTDDEMRILTSRQKESVIDRRIKKKEIEYRELCDRVEEMKKLLQ